MKRTALILACLSTIWIFSCNSETELIPNIEAHQDCIDDFLIEFSMIEYNGEPIPCGDSYLVLFENDESKFAILHNDCADLLPQLLKDCDKNEICTYVTEHGCFEVVQNSKRIGIIGVAK